jgi:hypothetical protein
MHAAEVALAPAHNHQISASPAHYLQPQNQGMATPPTLYTIRIKGALGATALSAFPSMVPASKGGETVLTGLLEDRSAVFGALAQVEGLGLELLEVRRIQPRTKSPECIDPGSSR